MAAWQAHGPLSLRSTTQGVRMRPVAMVGRADELAELVDAWAHPSAGRGTRTVVVTGPVGTGKSLPVAPVLQPQRPRPAAVVAGRAREHPAAPYEWPDAGE